MAASQLVYSLIFNLLPPHFSRGSPRPRIGFDIQGYLLYFLLQAVDTNAVVM